MTSFGGDFFVTPNTMNFDDVMLGFASLGKTGNVGVIIAVFVFFMLYILGVVFARRADKRDKLQVTETSRKATGNGHVGCQALGAVDMLYNIYIYIYILFFFFAWEEGFIKLNLFYGGGNRRRLLF